MARVRKVVVECEQPLWLTEEEAFTLLMGLVRGAAVGSPGEDALLDKMGELCRSFLRGEQQLPVSAAREQEWVLECLEESMCLQAV